MAGGDGLDGQTGHNQHILIPLTALELLDGSETLMWAIQSIRQGHLTSGMVGK